MPNNSLDFALLEFSGSTTKFSGSIQNGQYVTASGNYSHAEGSATTAIGNYSHTEGSATTAIGNYSHAEGLGNVAVSDYQSVKGKYNKISSGSAAVIVGNGTSAGSRNNFFVALPDSGSLQFSSSINVSGSFKSSNNIFSMTSITFGTLTNTRVYYVWRCPISCSLIGMYGCATNGTSGGGVKLRKNISGSGAYQFHMNSTVAPSNFTNTMYSLGTPLNTSYAPGDILEYEYTASTGTVNVMFVQADFIT